MNIGSRSLQYYNYYFIFSIAFITDFIFKHGLYNTWSSSKQSLRGNDQQELWGTEWSQVANRSKSKNAFKFQLHESAGKWNGKLKDANSYEKAESQIQREGWWRSTDGPASDLALRSARQVEELKKKRRTESEQLRVMGFGFFFVAGKP